MRAPLGNSQAVLQAERDKDMQTIEFTYPSKADSLMIAATRWGAPDGAKAVFSSPTVWRSIWRAMNGLPGR